MKYNIHTLLIIILSVCLYSCNEVSIKNITGKNVPVDSLIVKDSLINAYIDPYKMQIEDKMNTIIGKSDKELNSYFPESPLSNFVADLILEKVKNYTKENKIDTLDMFSLINIKGLRSSIPQGDIKVGDIFRLMPFENEIVLLTLPGDSVLSLFQFLGKTNGDGIGGATVSYKENEINKITINNKKFDPKKNYFLATSDYLANGGDYYTMITHPINRNGLSYKVREAIINYIRTLNQNHKTVVSDKDNRIKFE